MPDRISKPFELSQLAGKLPKPMAMMVRSPLEMLMSFPKLNATYRALDCDGTPVDFCRAVLDHFYIEIKISEEDLQRIPKQGPAIVVANHPFGGIEGVMLLHVLGKIRPDFKVMANYLLAMIPELKPLLIEVDPFGSKKAKLNNVRGLKSALSWLRNGGLMGVFPSGQVAHLEVSKRRVIESQWSSHIASLARRTGADVVPMFFDGSNGPLFQVAGLIHPKLRTMLLPREMLNKRSRRCRVSVGLPVSAAQLSAMDNDEQAIEYLRLRTCCLASRTSPKLRRKHKGPKSKTLRRPRWRRPAAVKNLVPEVSSHLVAQDIAKLSPDALLAEAGDMQVWIADAPQMRHLLPELGRLREQAFRAVGEGTGKSLDLDEFDQWYHHLILWNARDKEIAGSYRVGAMDEILSAHGLRGLYVPSLFPYSNAFVKMVQPMGAELGRSFVRLEYQRNYTSLMLLWKGIGAFLARSQKYRLLIGPVSISSNYRPISRAMIASFLFSDNYRSPQASLVHANNPFEPRKFADAEMIKLARMTTDPAELGRIISDIEPDGKALPILLRQYLKMSARALAFGVDPDFGYCVDCLCMVDVPNMDFRQLKRYMGDAEAKTYRAYHLHRMLSLPHVVPART